jgi:hypothetical protein
MRFASAAAGAPTIWTRLHPVNFSITYKAGAQSGQVSYPAILFAVC